jgi:flagellar biosynthetic protein FliR
MQQLYDLLSGRIEYFLLLFLRITALIVSSPVFGRKTLPNAVKIALCLMIAFVVFSAAPAAQAPAYGNLAEYVFLCIKEILFGLILGYVTTLFFSIVQTAGATIDMQIGFGMASIYDAQSNVSVPVTGNLLNIVLVVCFFAVNGHLKLIRIVMQTFDVMPVGQVHLNLSLAQIAMEVFTLSFVLALNVAMPMIVAGLLAELVLGVIVRMVPQMNMFVVSIPLKILLGFLVMIITIPVYVSFTNVLFDRMFGAIEKMFEAMAAA